MIRPQDLRECVIRPVLKALELHSAEAEDLLMLTAAQESKLGFHLVQMNGPALGIYQIEPATHRDILRYLSQRPDLASRVGMFTIIGSNDELIWNLAYATAIARIKYYMVPPPIPLSLEGQAGYYKKYYNTPLGKATVAEALGNYKRYVGEE